MRHITITLLFLALCLGAVAQKPIRHPSTTTTTPSKPSTPSKPTKPTKPSKPAKRTNTTPSGYTVHAIHTPEAVDLGLSVKWASFNLGASKPEETGNYYAWGETKPTAKYDESKKSKYPEGTTLKPEDDAATVNLGGKWRMPTISEVFEMIGKCSCQWARVNGVNGMRFTAPNGNSIFLPISGCRYGSNGALDNTTKFGYYWSSSAFDQFDGCYLAFYPSSRECSSYTRSFGFPIRPVLAE